MHSAIYERYSLCPNIFLVKKTRYFNGNAGRPQLGHRSSPALHGAPHWPTPIVVLAVSHRCKARCCAYLVSFHENFPVVFRTSQQRDHKVNCAEEHSCFLCESNRCLSSLHFDRGVPWFGFSRFGRSLSLLNLSTAFAEMCSINKT